MLCGETLSPGVCPALRLFVAFAELPQASKWRKWPLRNFRKPQNGKNGPCGTSASIKMGKMALAEFPQTPKSFPRHLRESRKRQKVSRETCGTSANAKKFSEALAGLPQTPKSFSRDLRDSRKHQKVFRGTCGAPANAHPFWGSMARNGTTKTAGYRRVCAPQVPGRICWRSLLIPSVCRG